MKIYQKKSKNYTTKHVCLVVNLPFVKIFKLPNNYGQSVDSTFFARKPDFIPIYGHI